MTNDEIKEMLYEIIKVYSDFNGNINGLLLVNDYINKLKEKDVT